MIIVVLIPVQTFNKYNFSKPLYKIISKVKSDLGSALKKKTADTFLNVSVNNAEYSKDVSVPALVDGQPFGVLNGSYINNDLLTTGSQRNRVLVRFTNDTAATRTIRCGVFIGG